MTLSYRAFPLSPIGSCVSFPGPDIYIPRSYKFGGLLSILTDQDTCQPGQYLVILTLLEADFFVQPQSQQPKQTSYVTPSWVS